MTCILDNEVSEYLAEEPCEGKLHAGFCEGSQIAEVKIKFNLRRLL